MSVEILHLETIAAEQLARRQRKIALKEAFNEINKLIINTGKYPKAKAAMDIVVALVDPLVHFDNGRVLQLPSTQDEPLLPKAAMVAEYKANLAREEYLTKKFPELIFLLNQFNLALQESANDQLIQDLLRGLVFVGGDINAFIADPNSGRLQQHHKLERDFTELTMEKYEEIRKNLYQTYAYPKTGQIRVVWEISMMTINGSNHEFTDMVEVIASPIDRELLEIYLQAAIANGMIFKSNTHLELFELLCESGKIKTLAILPNEMRMSKNKNKKKEFSFDKLRHRPTKEELSAILQSINSNAPVYVV